jgi:peptidyl-prolyl cis-trans isomerase C
VNGVELKKKTMLAQATGMLQQGTVPTVEFYRAVIEQMVGTRLLFEQSVAHKLTPTDEEVEQAYGTLRQRFQGTDEEFAKKAAENGLTIVDLKQGIRENMAIRKLVAQEIQPKIAVSEADAQKFYNENSARMQRPEQVNASHILIGLKPGSTAADKAAAKKKADEVAAKLKAGGDFAQLAKENSDDPGSKVQGGDLGWFSKGQMVPAFDAAAFALKPGETSGVVESEFGFHIIRVKEHRPAGQAPFAEAKAQITNYLKESALRDALTKLVSELRAKAKVEVAI